ncbi:hypothetical protein [Shimia sp. FJ5]|uniref:hypothetical protein n=1 Tax=Shimia sp. FJ5 TaxID=3079054 RepID=UPI002631F38B|nr:hypothetical protein [Shimia sp. FJ5]MDV4145049.1 hypothetical protein [Shimia sp. FJ5]
MPLSVLIPVVVIGIAGIAVILHLLGLTAPRRLADRAEALAAWAREFPELPATDAQLSADQRAALILMDTGDAGLVWCFGADTVARPLAGSNLRETETGFDIRLHDVGAPRVTVTLTPEDRPRWKEALRA